MVPNPSTHSSHEPDAPGGTGAGGNSTQQGGTPGRSGALLIAEDEPMIARILSDKLTREGYLVAWARSIAEMENELASRAFDLVLVDVTLESDGIDYAASMSNTPRFGWMALTESRYPQDEQRALDAGAVGVVVKPFKPTLVAAKIAATLAADPPAGGEGFL